MDIYIWIYIRVNHRCQPEKRLKNLCFLPAPPKIARSVDVWTALELGWCHIQLPSKPPRHLLKRMPKGCDKSTSLVWKRWCLLPLKKNLSMMRILILFKGWVVSMSRGYFHGLWRSNPNNAPWKGKSPHKCTIHLQQVWFPPKMGNLNLMIPARWVFWKITNP